MKSKFLPSPAMVVACIALIVALGGASYAAIALPANSVATKQLKKKAVTSAKLHAQAVTPSKVAPSTIALFRGQTGAKGDSGAPGQPGAPGQNGKNGVSGYKVVSAQSLYSNTASKTLNINCPVGKVPIGGGGATTLAPDSEVLAESFPTETGNGTWHGWHVTLRNSGPSTSWSILAWTICADAG